MATVKDIQMTLFAKLVEGTGIKLENYPKIRVFLTEEEHNKLAREVHLLSTYVFSRNLCFILLEEHGLYYFVTLGLDNELNSKILKPVENAIEITLTAIEKSGVERISTVSEALLLEKVFVSKDTENVYWESIEEFFPEIQTYQILDNVGTTQEDFSVYLKRLALFAMCNHPEMLILGFEVPTLQKYVEIFDSGDQNISIDNLLHSLGSNYWKFCFVDIYRCIERLFVLAWVHNYKTTMQSSLTPNQIHDALKNRFRIEKHEKENIEYLFTLLDPATRALLTPASGGMNPDNYIYELRNKIVHYQKTETEIDGIDAGKWNVIVRFLLASILELYPQFSGYITDLPND